MNLGFGGLEFVVIIVLALVVVGPKDLPKILRTLGRFVGQARGMAKDFQRSFDEMGREVELGELRQEIDALKSANPVEQVRKEIRGIEDDIRSPDDIRAAKLKAAEESGLIVDDDKSIAPPSRKTIAPKPDPIRTGAPEDD